MTLEGTFPIAGGAKKPPLVQWEEFQRRRPTDEERADWATRFPNANQALATGAVSGVFVLDVDVRHGGMDSLRGLVLPRTRTVLTPHEGWHFYFRHPGFPVPCIVGLLPGVDVKGDGGYVLVPRSIVDDHPYELTIDEPVVAAPLWVLKQLRHRSRGNQNGTRKWKAALAAVPQGSQDTHLAALAGKLARELPDDLWNTIPFALAGAAAQYPQDPRHPYTQGDFNRIAESICGKERARRTGSLPVMVTDTHAHSERSIVDVEAVVRRWLLLPDLRVVRLLAATVIVNLLEGDPLWTFLISPPSGGKTELLNALSGIPTIYRLSELTPQTLLSGFREDKAASLLPKLTGKIVVFKDFTTVLTMHREARQAILAQLREVYDGGVTKAFGTGKTIEWSGKIGFIAGVTEVIDTHYAVYQTLGERFVQYRLPAVAPIDLARFAIKHRGHESLMRQELREAFASFFAGRQFPPIGDILLPDPVQEELATLASFIVRARSGVIRDTFSTREIEYVPEPEAPARLAKQLVTLAAALAIVDGANAVTDAQMPLVTKVGLDCLLKHRLRVLTALLTSGVDATTPTIAEAIDYPTNTTRRILEDLTALGVLSREKAGRGLPDCWHLTETCETVLRAALERVSSTVPETSDHYINTPHSHRDDFSGTVVDARDEDG